MPLQTIDNAEVPPKKTKNKQKNSKSLPPTQKQEEQEKEKKKEKSKAVQTFDISLVSLPYVWPTRYLICGM